MREKPHPLRNPGGVLAIGLALLMIAQSGSAEGGWPFEQNLAVSETFAIAGAAGDCLERQDVRGLFAERVRSLGLSPGPRSVENRERLRLVSEPQRQADRLVYHYLSIGASLCTPIDRANYPCLSVYAARIEAPAGADGRPEQRRALNDPDVATVALLELAREIAGRCGHVPEGRE